MAKASILVVDDEAIIAMNLRNRLERLGYEVFMPVASGEEAIEKAGELSPDLILMDIVLLGELDGIDAAAKIRSEYDIPIIYLTAYSDEAILERAKITEPFGYIIKPFKDRELNTSIEMALYKHRMDSELKEREEWFSTTLNGIGDAVIATDTGETVTFMNPIAEELTGWSSAEAMGRPLREVFNIINEQTRKPCASPVSEAIEKDSIVGIANNTMLINRDGSERIIADSGAPIRDRKGNLIGVVLVFRDVTEKKRTEKMISRQNEFLRNILESLTHPFYVIGADDYVIRMANSACNFKDLNEKSTCYALTHHRDTPCDGIEHPCTIKEIKKTGKSVILEHVHYDTDGKQRILEVHGYPLFNSEGEIEEVSEYSIDISARKSLEEQLRMSQRLESIGRLAGGVAHDFNNLLTAILGYSERAYDMLPEDHEVRERVRFVMEAGQKAANLTAQLLAFSRKQVLELKTVDMCDISENVLKILHRVIGEDIRLEFNSDSELCSIRADISQMEQILLNLSINARSAMSSGGRLSIELSNIELDEEYAESRDEIIPGKYVLLEVADNGRGMSPEVRKRIFEPFFTTKDGGHGLGLATVYGIVKQHKGHIFVYSEVGKGTTFKIYLPAVPDAAEAIIRTKHLTSLNGTETILVVDDEPSILRLLIDSLSPLGYKVLEASSAEEAIKLCENTREDIHVLLTDMVMQGMNGSELAKRLVAQRPSLKVIIMSGYSVSILTDDNMLGEGAVFVQKPISPKKIASKLREIMDEGSTN